jgi:hypothetical protein
VVKRIDNVSQSNTFLQVHNKIQPTHTFLLFRVRGSDDRDDFLGGSDVLGGGVLLLFLAGGSSDSLTTIKSGL